VIRPVTAALAALLAVALWATPAAAHGGAVITLNSDGRGAVWLTAMATDGHPIEDLSEVTVRAREAAGTTVADHQMVKSSAPGTLVSMRTLTAGRWTVEVELGPPVYRSCTGTFTVAADATTGTAKTESTRCDPPAAVSSAAPQAAAGPDRLGLWAVGTAAVAGLAIGALALVMSRRRRQGQPAA
jgi:hypothetical protein